MRTDWIDAMFDGEDSHTPPSERAEVVSAPRKTRADIDLNLIKQDIARDSERRLAEAEAQAEKNKTIDKAKEFAFTLWAYYNELQETGFSEEQAMKIVELVVQNQK